jgi:hypothetical protein
VDSNIDHLWQVLLWGLGACGAGFLFLVGWIWLLVRKVNETETMQENMKKMKESLEKIEIALLGSYDKPYDGLVHRHRDLEQRVSRIEESGSGKNR